MHGDQNSRASAFLIHMKPVYKKLVLELSESYDTFGTL